MAGEYEWTIEYIDSAIVYLNKHYEKHAAEVGPLMKRSGSGQAAEIVWWQQYFDTDYHVILDIRNEAAVAFLALRNWDDYRYNNTAYTRLYKLLGEDTTLEAYCKEMQHSSGNKTVSIILCLLLMVLMGVASYILYFRRRIMYRFDLEQVLAINNDIIASSIQPTESDDMLAIPQRILKDAFESINDLLEIKALGIALYNEEEKRLHYTCYPAYANEEELNHKMRRCYEEQRIINTGQTGIQCYPLYTELRDKPQYLGAFSIVRKHIDRQEDEELLSELISRYLSIILMNVVIRMGNKYRDIELAQDDKSRAKHEENLLHVQNLVLDNCLSTIKHETLYYPNKIKQIVETLLRQVPAEKEKELVSNMEELVSYYKDIFTLLSSCAARQLEGVTFRRSHVEVKELMEHALKYLKRTNKKKGQAITMEVTPCDTQVVGDATLLKYLLENLVDALSAQPDTENLYLSARQTESFVRFDISNATGQYTQEALNQLFYPDMRRMQQGSDGQLKGTEFLICKQIIRDHDEYTGFRGCRINAEPRPEGGVTIWFTIPSLL